MKHYELFEERIHSLSEALPEDNTELVELLEFSARLPDYEKVNKSSLEAVFQELKINKDIPLVRFFSKQGISKPLVRLAAGPSGVPLIVDKNILRILFTDIPYHENSSVVFIQKPIISSSAPKGTCWKIFIYDNGHIFISLNAPRADKLLRRVVLEAAFSILPDMIKHLDYSSSVLSSLSLTNCSAKYRMDGIGNIKPKDEELRKRIYDYIPLLFEEKIPNRAYDLALRLRIYSDEEDKPNFSHIQNAISLYKFNKYDDAKQISTYLENEYGLGPEEIANEITYWVQNNQYIFDIIPRIFCIYTSVD
jgi:hypothetical protein